MPKLIPPQDGVSVRMYRIGHGDCFLIAIPRENENQPYYILIDCGAKNGSRKFLPNKDIKAIIDQLAEATGKIIDLVIVTHEHEDHVNAFWKKRSPYFKDFTIKEAWFAWTENPADELANKLRQTHKDQLLQLVESRDKLGMMLKEENSTLERLDDLLGMEFGNTNDQVLSVDELRGLVEDPSKSSNKQAMKYVKDKAQENKGVRYLNPGEVVNLDETRVMQKTNGNGTQQVKAYILGPPRDEKLLLDEDPRANEGFQTHKAHMFSFNNAVTTEDNTSPFRREFRINNEDAFGHGFFKEYYGKEDILDIEDHDQKETFSNAPWRRIDEEWLYIAESMALKLNDGINNTSLVVAFELPGSKKVLLFGGDAQRGSWVSWNDHSFSEEGTSKTAKEILGQTVLYKACHHGSHNATLNGKIDDDHPNISWLGVGKFSNEFTTMIPAASKWANSKSKPWRHPLPTIKEALVKKSQGRVFQTNESNLKKPENISDTEWKRFIDRTEIDDLYFDYQIFDR
ncbi:hypothetical protein POV27_09565 [Aureisphaera galaxeae]|uniref:hypothetical protein n=1 Tax=Aureisphaera galaxeae TaxID=1538023 RepID=UPI00234FE33C|nr:hypothetical protein [Aureisphaera galaxeae]MDC8004298.1 hypothetical protein [Aureisphaera galaxeae]